MSVVEPPRPAVLGIEDGCQEPEPIRESLGPDGLEATDANPEPPRDTDADPQPPLWRRVVEHKTFLPTVITLGSLVAGGIALMVTRSPGAAREVAGRVSTHAPQLSSVANKVLEATARMSPAEHLVSGYQRVQHFGPGGVDTRVIQVAPYMRGGVH